ncbi:hypothetical protein N1851_009707 [Merluccius polli]|uniref:Uncharacterized protein n=1 Tax=Merluccius polli TaxID=89951 RepID=A0AA47P3S2_MERPO|nr:hypothetical protein N1851_009707 [Merluccius polli]
MCSSKLLSCFWNLTSKHAKDIEHEVEPGVIVESDVAINASSQHFEVAASSSQVVTASSSEVVPVSNASIQDICSICYCTSSGLWCRPVHVKYFSVEYGRDEVEQLFEKLENPFTSLNTESKRNVFFEKKWKTVQPVEKVLGVRFENRKNRSTGTYDQVVVTNKFAYVQILQTLQSILENPNLRDMLTSSHTPKDNVYFDLKDGLYMKRHPLFSTDSCALQIQLFYDDFETSNPLGSKKGIHKLGGIYFTLRNFPPKVNSTLVNIHLCALFHAQDIKTYGFDAILQPIVSDLKMLETDGIKVPALKGPVHGSIVQVTGDNLGIHSLFGLVESFIARNCCRFCLLEKSHFQNVFCEDAESVIFRTKAMHEEHCHTAQTNPQLTHVYGVKRSCLLNSLQYFHTVENYSVDIMHDVLEGVGQFELKLVLEYVQVNFITAREMARRISHLTMATLKGEIVPLQSSYLMEATIWALMPYSPGVCCVTRH